MRLKNFEQKIPFKVAVILTVAISLTMLLPFLLFGVPYAPDNIHHFQVASSYAQAISVGDFFPSWSAHENFGYGSLGVRLYPPFPYYVLVFIHFATGEWYWASLFTYAFWILLGGLGVYLLAREFYSPHTALFAVVIFAFMPYRYYEIYHATMYGEFAGCAVLTFSFYFVLRVCKYGKYTDVIGLSVAYAVLILTHLPLTIIGSICLFVFSLASSRHGRIVRTAALLVSSVSASMLSTAFFWTRVLTERKWIAGHKIYFPSLIYTFRENYLPFSSINDLGMLYFDSFLLLPIILVIVSVLAYVVLNDQKEKYRLISIGTLFAFSCLLILNISSPLWESFSLLQEVQFPWRFLVVTSISGSILAVSGWQKFFEIYRSPKRPVALLLCGSLLILIVYCFVQPVRNGVYMPKGEFTQWRDDNDKSIGLEFWWTIWARYEAVKPSEKVLAENREIQIGKWTATEREFNISAGEATQARVAVFYYPYWQATVNKISVESILANDGAMLIPISAEKSTVKIWFQEPSYIILAKYISILTWLLFGLTVLFYFFTKKKSNFSSSKKTFNLLSE